MEGKERSFTDNIRALKGFRGMRSCYHSTIRLSKTKISQFQLEHKFYWQQNKLGGNVTGDFSLLFVKIHQCAALTSLYCTILGEIKHYQSYVALVTFFYHLAKFQTSVFLWIPSYVHKVTHSIQLCFTLPCCAWCDYWTSHCNKVNTSWWPKEWITANKVKRKILWNIREISFFFNLRS